LTKPIVFKFAGDNSPLKKSIKSTGDELGNLGSKIKSSFSPASLLAPLAAAGTFQAITSTLIESSKAFVADAKSQQMLNIAIDNNTNATDGQKTAIEASIKKLSMLSGVVDDEIRPAMAQLVQATGSTSVSMDLMQTAMDVSAGTGKDLTTVTAAMSKAYNGNYAALGKLVPGIKKGADGLAQLKEKFKGSAEAAGNTDPFARMAIVVDDLKESLGAEVTPYIQKFVNWINSADGERAVQSLKTSFKALFEYIDLMFQSLAANPVWQGLIKILNLTSGAIAGLGDQSVQSTHVFNDSMTLTAEQIKAKFIDPLTEAQKNTPEFKAWLTQIEKKMPELKKLLEGTGSAATSVADRIKGAADQIKNAGKKFKESMSFGDFLNEDNSIFDASKFMEKFRGIVAAAKALPAKLKALRKAGASPEVLQQIVAMGPEQGLAVAQGFLDNAGSAKEYSKSLNTLSVLGQQSAAVGVQSSNYSININKANMTAEEIITAIQKYERKTGKKVNWN
jgi:hypothetical protein